MFTDSNIVMQKYALNVNTVPQNVLKRPAYEDNFREVYTIRLVRGPLQKWTKHWRGMK